MIGNNIFSKLKEFMQKLFKRDKMLELQESIFPETNEEFKNERINNSQNDFNESLKQEFKNHENKASIIDTVNNNPDVLESLPTERLIQLNKMYDEKISEARRELEELKRRINKM